MSTYVLDTSVAIAWYLPEAFSASARHWQTKVLRDEVTLYVPSLHYLEFANVLRTYVRRGELDSVLASDIFDLHLEAPLEPAEPDRRQTLATALEYEATVYDAVYIALALEMEVPLITAERTTTPWVVKMGDRAKLVTADDS